MVKGGDGRVAVDGRGGVQSVGRALDVLEALGSAGGPVGLTELVASTGLPLATVHRLLATLAGRGYVRQDPETRRYVLGPGVLRLREPVGRLLATWARPHLSLLARTVRETANLAVLDDDHVLYVAQVAPPRKLRMFTEVGNRVLPHSTAVGKVLLAARPRAEAERVVARHGLPARTPHTITDPRRFFAELDAVAARGWAVDSGEEEEGVRCVAVPVPGLEGEPAPAAALSVSGPVARIEHAERHRLVADLLAVAEDLVRSIDTGTAGLQEDQGQWPAAADGPREGADGPRRS